MNNKIFISLIFFFAIIIGCSKDALVSPELTPGKQESVSAKAGGAETNIGENSGSSAGIRGWLFCSNW